MCYLSALHPKPEARQHGEPHPSLLTSPDAGQMTTPVNARPDFIELSPSDWQTSIAAACTKLLSQQDRVVLCITGRTGTGKSTLGRKLRKQGLPGIPARNIAVLDDGVMSHMVLGIWHRRIRIPSQSRDELAPFAPYLKNKRVLVYVSSNPGGRLSACDIHLQLFCPEDLRHQRLLGRNADGEQRYQRSIQNADPHGIPARLAFTLSTDGGNSA